MVVFDCNVVVPIVVVGAVLVVVGCGGGFSFNSLWF